MNVDTGAFEDLAARVAALEAHQDRQDKIGAILVNAYGQEFPEILDSAREQPKPKRDRRGMRAVK